VSDEDVSGDVLPGVDGASGASVGDPSPVVGVAPSGVAIAPDVSGPGAFASLADVAGG
jgi:hypothetical protein